MVTFTVSNLISCKKESKQLGHLDRCRLEKQTCSNHILLSKYEQHFHPIV